MRFGTEKPSQQTPPARRETRPTRSVEVVSAVKQFIARGIEWPHIGVVVTRILIRNKWADERLFICIILQVGVQPVISIIVGNKT